MAKMTKAEFAKNEGQLIKVYGSNTLFAVAPVPHIDRVKFSIVELNSKGKDFIDIYLTTEEMRQFMAEVDSGVAQQKINADTGKYPSAYQWVRGENGCKRLIIGGGMKGIRIQASDNSNKEARRMKQAIIQVSDLMELSFMFKLAYGMIPVQSGSYYEQLFLAFTEAMSRKYGSSSFTEADEQVVAMMAETPAETPAEAPKAEPVAPEAPKEEYDIITAVSRGALQEAQGLKAVPIVVQETGESTNLLFTDEQAAGIKWFDAYAKKIANETATLVVKANRKGRYYYFVDTAKK